jgi:hypothetical protein
VSAHCGSVLRGALVGKEAFAGSVDEAAVDEGSHGFRDALLASSKEVSDLLEVQGTRRLLEVPEHFLGEGDPVRVRVGLEVGVVLDDLEVRHRLGDQRQADGLGGRRGAVLDRQDDVLAAAPEVEVAVAECGNVGASAEAEAGLLTGRGILAGVVRL